MGYSFMIRNGTIYPPTNLEALQAIHIKNVEQMITAECETLAHHVWTNKPVVLLFAVQKCYLFSRPMGPIY